MNMATYSINNNLEFLRHNNRSVKRDKKIKAIKLKGVHIFLIIFLFMTIAAGIFFLGRFIMSWEKLNVKSFTLVNCERINEAAIRKILYRYKGNILAIDLGRLREELLTINQVKDVAISRMLPSGIKLVFTKRIPILQFEFKGKWSIIDDEGIIIERGKRVEKNLITVKGVSKENIKKFIPYLDELNSIKKLVDYVSYRKPFGVLLRLKQSGITVFPGEQEFRKKISYFIKLKERDVLKDLKITSIDMRFQNRIYLEYEKTDVING